MLGVNNSFEVVNNKITAEEFYKNHDKILNKNWFDKNGNWFFVDYFDHEKQKVRIITGNRNKKGEGVLVDIKKLDELITKDGFNISESEYQSLKQKEMETPKKFQPKEFEVTGDETKESGWAGHNEGEMINNDYGHWTAEKMETPKSFQPKEFEVTGDETKESGWAGHNEGEMINNDYGHWTAEENGENKKTIKVNIASVDEVAKAYAWRMAEEKVRDMLYSPEEDREKGGRWQSIKNSVLAPFRHPIKWGKKVWMRGAEAGYQKKFYDEALAAIRDNQDLMLDMESYYRLGKDSKFTKKDATDSLNYEILDKIMEEYAANAVENEEKGNKLEDPVANARFQELFARHYKSNFTREQFESEVKKIINDLKNKGIVSNEDFLGKSGRKKGEVSEGLMYASNLFALAEDYKKQVESKIDEIAKEKNLSPEDKKLMEEHYLSMMNLDINLGAKMADIHNKRPQDTLNSLEKFVTWTQRMPVLRKIVNPGTAAIMAAAGSYWGGKRLATGAAALGLGATGIATGVWIPVAAAALAGGGFAAFRRSVEAKKDRAMHQRQRVLGKEDDGFRREKMDKFEYDIASSNELIKQLEAIEKVGSYGQINDQQKNELASMFARFKLEKAQEMKYAEGGENRTVDLIAGSQEEGERTGTNYISKTDLKIKLYNYLRTNNLIDDKNAPTRNQEDFVGLFNKEAGRLYKNILEQDKAFDSYRRKSMLTHGALAGVAAGASVVGMQYFHEWLNGGSTNSVEKVVSHPRTMDEVAQSGGYQTREVKIQDFVHDGPSEPGIRALPDVEENLINNLKLNANGVELATRLDLNEQGQLVLDISSMSKVPGGEFLKDELAKGHIHAFISRDNTGEALKEAIDIPFDKTTGKIIIDPNGPLKHFFNLDNMDSRFPGDKVNGLITIGVETDDVTNETSHIYSLSALYGQPADLGEISEKIIQEVPAPKGGDWLEYLAVSGAPRQPLEGAKKKTETVKQEEVVKETVKKEEKNSEKKPEAKVKVESSEKKPKTNSDESKIEVESNVKESEKKEEKMRFYLEDDEILPAKDKFENSKSVFADRKKLLAILNSEGSKKSWGVEEVREYISRINAMENANKEGAKMDMNNGNSGEIVKLYKNYKEKFDKKIKLNEFVYCLREGLKGYQGLGLSGTV